MQRDHRFTGTGATFDDENAFQVVADNAILIALNGGDDVAHAAGAMALQGGEQGGLAGQLRRIDRVEIEDVVIEAQDAAFTVCRCRRRVTPYRSHRRGAVERLRRRRPPVDQQLLMLVIAQAQAADVEVLGVIEIEPAEAQVALGGGQLGAAVLVELGERFALRRRLVVLGGRARAGLIAAAADVAARSASSRAYSIVRFACSRASSVFSLDGAFFGGANLKIGTKEAPPFMRGSREFPR